MASYFLFALCFSGTVNKVIQVPLKVSVYDTTLVLKAQGKLKKRG